MPITTFAHNLPSFQVAPRELRTGRLVRSVDWLTNESSHRRLRQRRDLTHDPFHLRYPVVAGRPQAANRSVFLFIEIKLIVWHPFAVEAYVEELHGIRFIYVGLRGFVWVENGISG